MGRPHLPIQSRLTFVQTKRAIHQMFRGKAALQRGTSLKDNTQQWAVTIEIEVDGKKAIGMLGQGKTFEALLIDIQKNAAKANAARAAAAVEAAKP